MRDVAKRAKVSQSTVSRVLNPSPHGIPIGAQTRQRVLEAVEELGYHPNLNAGSLRGQKTQLIAMMIADISNPFYHPMVRAVQDIAHAHRYDVLVANSDHLRSNEELFCNSIIRRPVDGVIMVPYHLNDEDIEQLYRQTGSPIAALGGHITHPQVDVIHLDDAQAVYDLTTWLHQNRGHKSIGYIGVTHAFATGQRRYRAYKQALYDAGLQAHADWFIQGDWSVESGKAAMTEFLQQAQPPTALVAANDLMAIGAIVAAKEAGVRVPDEMAVVGFDDIPAASWIQPQLTTVAQPAAEIGMALATAIFNRINGVENEEPVRHGIPFTIVERESA